MDHLLSAHDLGLAAKDAASLDSLTPFTGPLNDSPLIGRDHAHAALEPFALDAADAAELLTWWPDATWPAPQRRLLAACYAHICADVGRPGWVNWPTLNSAADPRVRCAPVYAFAAAVPALLAHHARLGVSAAVSAATLADVGRHVAKTRAMFGRVGLELPVWIALHYRGFLYEVGRLQYEPSQLGPSSAVTWYPDADQGALEEDLRTGRPSTRLHIPETGPLDPAAVEKSLKAARPVLAAVTGAPVPVATCTSWLLDPQLKAYLPATSNIIAFQDRFTLVEEAAPGDSDVFRFVFRRTEVVPDLVAPVSRLEHAVVDLLERGGHWQVRTGWLRLP